MGFEKVVLDEVAKVMKSDTTAEFTDGTLFVRCTVEEAIQIETALLGKFKCGILLNRCGDESAFDFV